MWPVLHNVPIVINSALDIISLKGLSGTVHEERQLSSCSFMASESVLKSCVLSFTRASFEQSCLYNLLVNFSFFNL